MTRQRRIIRGPGTRRRMLSTDCLSCPGARRAGFASSPAGTCAPATSAPTTSGCGRGCSSWPEIPIHRVRGDVIHALTDSTPASRVPAVIQALESRHNDPDAGIRRQVRKTLARYRRTGKVTDAAH